jgi:hypothetical protein
MSKITVELSAIYKAVNILLTYLLYVVSGDAKSKQRGDRDVRFGKEIKTMQRVSVAEQGVL